MNKLLLVAGLSLIASSLFLLNTQATPQLENYGDMSAQFAQYKQSFNKKYSSSTEDVFRFMIYSNNMLEVVTHNSNPENTWRMGETQFSDLSQPEFEAIYLTALPEQQDESLEVYEDRDFVPNGTVDWRSKSGVATHIKNQGQCGSCWAFSAVAAVEAYYAVVKGQKNLDISEQQLVDCSKQNQGCNGGWNNVALNYVAQNGLTTTAAYPYTARDGKCKTAGGAYKISGPQRVGADVGSHQSALGQRPFSVCVDASNWSQYKSGVLSNCGKSTNHCVAAFGYDGSNNWIIKNSWGTSWGEKGYIRLAPGNTCNVLSESYHAA